MSLAEIKEAISILSPEERAELATFIHNEDDDEWDRQMEKDAANGKFDALIEEADCEEREGRLEDWPASP